ncbi:hypothetical protein K7G42_06055 [Streptococcus parauberis]|uniref:Uncharacterized protein n=2 Tax=Streptococcus parauberis TaxID=1348 RepID=A0ABN0ISM6_9STRE|nr:hypothetical protein [Streptococcus parauberis]EMG25907.1 hypothetical protein SPJ1_0584 [Streptococcus parauberis KRS-02083]WEM66089.1 hypothetical protein P1T45_05760 [Streptococcus parauberis]WOF45983.1 hypothetical protein K7G42_06055 [Streptococcus parauberis]
MDSIIKLLIEFEGIIGAILGSVATLITTELLKSRGKIRLYLRDFIGVYQTYRDVGAGRSGKTDDDFYGYKMKYSFEVYNGTDLSRIMRGFRVVFYNGDKAVFSEIPKNEETRRYSQHFSSIDEMEILNIYPREIQVLKHSLYISEEDLDKIEDSTKIVMTYYNEKDKQKSLILSDEKVTKKDYKPK